MKQEAGASPPFVAIEDPADPRVEPFLNVRDRDLVGRQGLFMAEGEVVLRHLIGSPRCSPVAFLVAAPRAPRFAEMIAGVAPGAPVYVAEPAVMDAIVGFHIHRGLLGLGRLPAASADEVLEGLGPQATVVAVHGVGNHDNMGGIFRNAAAFGADAVVLDAGCCDPLYRKALRVSVGAALVTPFARLRPSEDLVDRLAGEGFEVVSLSPSGRETLADFRPAARTAVLFGAEGPGLPADLLSRTRSVRIPMAAGFDSLNVATTSGVVLHHIAARRA
ncbi:RNA methyltransferase [Phenylobacterium sp.]|uniref:TrmH family RNA methyltransferase n=1 Tax=Phenylobacterium sp. TaxID=1871053 RepID=UPI0025E78EB6|nr:RNA methyltransferase [Phenylobacterium sp.]